MKRALAPGMRVHTRFWNEITEQKYGRGEDNPLIRTATVLSVGFGRVRLAFDASEDPDIRASSGPRYSGEYELDVPAIIVHRGEPSQGPDQALIRRDKTWRRQRSPESDKREVYRFSSLSLYASRDYISFRAWLRLGRDYELRHNQPALARERVRRAAKDRARHKSEMAFLAEQLRTPMTYPPGHPGCDQPIYPMLHADGNRLGDGYRCEIHGEVTEAVFDAYYRPRPRGKRIQA